MNNNNKEKIDLPSGVEHGTRRGFLRGCWCFDCHGADRAYKREWNRQRIARVRQPAAEIKELATKAVSELGFTVPELAARITLSATTIREIMSGRRGYLNPSTYTVAKERLQELCSKFQG